MQTQSPLKGEEGVGKCLHQDVVKDWLPSGYKAQGAGARLAPVLASPEAPLAQGRRFGC